MGIVNFILNLAGLLLWLNWRSNRFDPLVRRTPATLMGTLRPASPKPLRPWHLLAFLGGLLLLRALVYWWVGGERNWPGKLNLGLTVIWFSGGLNWSGLGHMVVFSFLSFGSLLGIFYLCLVPLSLLAGPLPIHGLVTIPLGRMDGWPRWIKAVLPLFATAVCWWVAGWVLQRLEILPHVSAAGRFQQGLALGAASYLVWKFPLGAILVLHLLNSYIYFGKNPFWKYVGATAQTILRPLKKVPLRAGKVDFAPLVGLVLIFLVAEVAEDGIPWIRLWGLVSLYGKLPL